MQPITFTTKEDIPAGSTITLEIGEPDSNPKPAPEPEPDPPARQMPKVERGELLFTNESLSFSRVDFPTEVFASNQWYQFFLAHNKSGQRNLYVRVADAVRLVREKVQHVQLQRVGTAIRLTIIVKDERDNFRTMHASDRFPFKDFRFSDDNRKSIPSTRPYAHGDAISRGVDFLTILKGNEFVHVGGKLTDYRRHWFNVNGECSFPLAEKNEEVYCLARWASPSGAEIAIVGLFQISNEVRTYNQNGRIIPVWAVSEDNGLTWEFPFGNEAAFPLDYEGGMILPGRLHSYDDRKLICTYGQCSFSHNRFRQTADPKTEAKRVWFDLNQTTEALGI